MIDKTKIYVYKRNMEGNEDCYDDILLGSKNNSDAIGYFYFQDFIVDAKEILPPEYGVIEKGLPIPHTFEDTYKENAVKYIEFLDKLEVGDSTLIHTNYTFHYWKELLPKRFKIGESNNHNDSVRVWRTE